MTSCPENIVSGLFTDLYSLTMAQGFFKRKMNSRAVFEMFFRRQPFEGGFSVFAGLETLLERLKSLSFSGEDIEYLSSIGIFEKDFLDFLASFRFSGSLWAMDEGSIVFPNEPLIRIDGGLIECQLIEGMLLNTINFQSLIATKTARVVLASKSEINGSSVMEFGLRRAQGFDGALSASRAAYIGGVIGTSNVLAGKSYGIPVIGTMAHSWIMAWPTEEEAFRAYANLYPEKSIFLIDTYDTLKSGIINAIKVGRELVEKGKNFGVRLDSGDVHYLSMEVRKKLDEAGFKTATISVSNDLDETIIKALTDAKAPVNIWGVGTNMVTGGSESAFTGVYKLAACEDEHGKLSSKIKFSDNPEKTTNPGIKQVWRILDEEGLLVADVLTLDDDHDHHDDIIEKGQTYTFWHPQADYRRFSHTVTGNAIPQLKLKMSGGKILVNMNLEEIRDNVRKGLDSLDNSYKRFLNPHIYKVSMSTGLRSLKLDLIKNYLGEI